MTHKPNYGYRAQEPCESGGGRPGLPVPNSPCGLCGRKATSKRMKGDVVAKVGKDIVDEGTAFVLCCIGVCCSYCRCVVL